jgi:hypothetical protein
MRFTRLTCDLIKLNRMVSSNFDSNNPHIICTCELNVPVPFSNCYSRSQFSGVTPDFNLPYTHYKKKKKKKREKKRKEKKRK